MTKDEIIKALRDMAKYPTVTLPRDCEALRMAADMLAQPEHCLDCGQELGDANHIHTCSPQRKPLTDEEIAHATAPVLMGGNPSLTGIARAIEAAHGIRHKRQHITDGSPCWCNPETDYVDPKTGAAVVVHKEPQ